MFKSENASQDFATRQALHWVWIPANGTPGAPLVSVWMDSMMRAFECQVEEAKETVVPASISARRKKGPKTARSLTVSGIKHSVWWIFNAVNMVGDGSGPVRQFTFSSPSNPSRLL